MILLVDVDKMILLVDWRFAESCVWLGFTFRPSVFVFAEGELVELSTGAVLP